MRNVRYVFFLLLLTLLLPSISAAQMFSVEEAPQRLTPPTAYIRMGVSLADFVYTGPLIVGENPEGIELDRGVFYVALESAGLSLNLALGNNLTGLGDQGFLNLDLSFSNRFPIVRQPRAFIGIPLQLKTALSSASSDQNDENFYQTSFGAGAGLFMNFRLTEKIYWSNEFIPGYGFSSSSGGFVGGSIFFMTGKSRLNFVNLIGRRSVSFGYDYQLRSFDIDEDLFDYDLTMHVLTIGVSL